MGPAHHLSLLRSLALSRLTDDDRLHGSMITIRPLEPGDKYWLRELLTAAWGSARVVSTSGLHDALHLPGLLAESDGQRVGLVTYDIRDGECEIVTLDSLLAGQGVGTQLLEAVRDAAAAAGCRRLWLITTNDNMPALRFYQRRGWDLVALHRDALAAWRRLKPEMPERGRDNIPLCQALELELLIEARLPSRRDARTISVAEID